MKLRCAFVAVLIASSFSAPAFAQSADAEYSIAGIVVDSVTGNPIRRAELSTILNREEVSTFSDESGRFRLDHLQPGKYQLYASAPAYVRQGLNQHGSFFTGVVTGNGLDSEHITFRIHPQALIRGRITDQNGEPVRNASVNLFAIANRVGQLPSMQAQQQTNDLGEYRFAHLLAGKYCVAVQAQPWYAQGGFNYVPVEPETASFRGLSRGPRGKPDPSLDVVYPLTFSPGVTDERSASEISVAEGETAEANIPMRTVPAAHLRLTGMPADHSLNVNVFQKVFGTVAMPLSIQTSEISPSEIEIAGLPPGDLTFAINRANTDEKERTIQANVSGSGTLDASRPLPSAKVSGRVFLPEGSGTIGDAGIMLVKDGEPATFTRLHKDGSFDLGALPLDTYHIFLNIPGEPKFFQKLTASGARVNGHDVVLTGVNDVDLTIVLGGGFSTISGIAMLNNRGVDGVMVLLVPDSGANLDDDSRMDQSDSDGSFQLGGIIPGKYRLVAIQDGWGLDWRAPAVLKPYLEKAEVLQISAREARKITVEVQKRIGSAVAAN